jgi:hypothetical protein
MSWYDAIRELCSFVVLETTIQDILETAVEENMLTRDEALEIAHGVSYEVSL